MNKLFTKRLISIVLIAAILVGGGSHLDDFLWPRTVRTRTVFIIATTNTRKLTDNKYYDKVKSKDDKLNEK